MEDRMEDPRKSELQAEIAELNESVTAARRRLGELLRQAAVGEVKDYVLRSLAGEPVPLSSLFGTHEDLIVVQNMGRNCPYCTLWGDGFGGLRRHIESRAAFVVVSPDAPEAARKYAETRGWNFRMLSSEGTRFKRDMGFESENGHQMPGVSTFRKKGEAIVNVANDYFGPGDPYCSIWHLFDLLEEGQNNWKPRIAY